MYSHKQLCMNVRISFICNSQKLGRNRDSTLMRFPWRWQWKAWYPWQTGRDGRTSSPSDLLWHQSSGGTGTSLTATHAWESMPPTSLCVVPCSVWLKQLLSESFTSWTVCVFWPLAREQVLMFPASSPPCLEYMRWKETQRSSPPCPSSGSEVLASLLFFSKYPCI